MSMLFKNSKRLAGISRSVILLAIITVFLFANIAAYAESTGEYSSEASNAYIDIAKGVINWRKTSLNITEEKDLFSNNFLAGAGTIDADWYAVALGRLGFSEAYYAYLAVVEKNVIERYKSEEKLDRVKATEWHRVGLAVLSCGGDPTRLADGTINLVADGSYNRGEKVKLDAQGQNALFWGLIMMDAMRYDIPKNAVDSREKVLVSILEQQLPDGGFAFGDESSAEITGMALQAIAPYYNSEEVFTYERSADKLECKKTVRSVIDAGINYLSAEQQENGGFLYGSEQSSESVSQVIVALCSLGINPAGDSRFIKNGRSLVDALMDFRQADGGFAHYISDGPEISDSIASAQALLALTALVRYEQRMHTIFDFRNEPNVGIKSQIIDFENAIDRLGKNPDKKTVQALYSNYLVIPAQERSYVRNYAILSDLMNDLNIPKTSEFLLTVMNQNAGGNGCIVNVLDGIGKNGLPHFTDEDASLALALPQNMTDDDAITMTVLLWKVQNAENRQNYKYTEELLLKKQQGIKTAEPRIDKDGAEIIIVIIVITAVVVAASAFGIYWYKKRKKQK